MARALLGHLGGNDPHTQIELVALRRRVGELQSEVADLRSRLDDQVTLARLDDEFVGADLSSHGSSADQLTLDEATAFEVITV